MSKDKTYGERSPRQKYLFILHLYFTDKLDGKSAHTPLTDSLERIQCSEKVISLHEARDRISSVSTPRGFDYLYLYLKPVGLIFRLQIHRPKNYEALIRRAKCSIAWYGGAPDFIPTLRVEAAHFWKEHSRREFITERRVILRRAFLNIYMCSAYPGIGSYIGLSQRNKSVWPEVLFAIL